MCVASAGKSAVIKRLGRWPCFHDSSIRECFFDGNGRARLLIKLTKADEGGFFPPNSAILFKFEDLKNVNLCVPPDDARMNDLEVSAPPTAALNALEFSQRNYVFDLEFEPTENGARLTIEPVPGFLKCTIEAGSIQAELVTLA